MSAALLLPGQMSATTGETVVLQILVSSAYAAAGALVAPLFVWSLMTKLPSSLPLLVLRSILGLPFLHAAAGWSAMMLVTDSSSWFFTTASDIAFILLLIALFLGASALVLWRWLAPQFKDLFQAK